MGEFDGSRHTFLLNVPVRVAKREFERMVRLAVEVGYPAVLRDGDRSAWVGDVCIGERNGSGAWVYPMSFARYGWPPAAS